MSLKKLLAPWMAFTRFIGRVNTVVLLTAFYLFVITPFGIIMRLLGKNCLKTPVSRSNWIERSDREDLKRQF